MNRLGFIILSILRKSDATSRLSSMTVREIATAEEFGLKENTIFKKIKDFENSGYIARPPGMLAVYWKKRAIP